MKFADALECIPQTLAENAGMDPIDTQVDIRSKHGQGKKWFGINVRTGKVSDMMADHVIEPAAVKEQIIRSATEAASMILAHRRRDCFWQDADTTDATRRRGWNGWHGRRRILG